MWGADLLRLFSEIKSAMVAEPELGGSRRQHVDEGRFASSFGPIKPKISPAPTFKFT